MRLIRGPRKKKVLSNTNSRGRVTETFVRTKLNSSIQICFSGNTCTSNTSHSHIYIFTHSQSTRHHTLRSNSLQFAEVQNRFIGIRSRNGWPVGHGGTIVSVIAPSVFVLPEPVCNFPTRSSTRSATALALFARLRDTKLMFATLGGRPKPV